MESLVIRAPAKVNLCLKIIKKRPDGYHEISTIFQKIGLFDELELQKTAAPGIRLTVDNPAVPSDRTNLVYRAAELIMGHCESRLGCRLSSCTSGYLQGQALAAAAAMRLPRLMA